MEKIIEIDKIMENIDLAIVHKRMEKIALNRARRK